jgi:hypothetical protein
MSTNKDKEKILPLGVDEETWNKKEPFKKSEETQSWDNKTNDAYSNLNKVTNEQIISNNTQKNLNKNFKVPSAVTEADAYLSEQLKKIQSGKTSYTDDIKNMMDKILNREKFSYDVDNDPLFQQALASAMKSGKQAMQDTIGQASALTGGYGSSYATSVGNQSYNAYIEDAYDNLPQYYQMAWNQYQAEGDEMYRQLGMFNDADDKEYNRYLTGYEVTSQYRNRAYDEAYNMYRDTKNDAFNMANLEMNVHGQKVSDAYNLYGATSNQADKLYEREYNSWLDNINMIYKDIEILRDDAWKNKEFDEGVRQYEQSFAEQQRQFNENMAEQKRQHNEQMSYNWANLNQQKVKKEEKTNSFTLTNPEIEKAKEILAEGGTRDDVLDYLAISGNIPMSSEDDAILDSVLGIGVGSVKNFRTNPNDNFDVVVRGEEYRVENHGKVTDETTKEQLKSVSKGDGKAFAYNNEGNIEAYVEKDREFYKIGATSIFGKETGGYKKLLNALK